eukprot:4126649-Lingulodinium_polyedra.AAC.1
MMCIAWRACACFGLESAASTTCSAVRCAAHWWSLPSPLWMRRQSMQQMLQLPQCRGTTSARAWARGMQRS